MFQFLFSFRGRVNRAKFWMFYLAWCFVAGMAGFALITGAHFLIAAGARPPWPLSSHWSPWDILMAAFFGAYFYAALAVIVKRLHDRNKSAWWLAFFYGVPVASLVALGFAGYLPQTTSQMPWVQFGAFLVNTVIIWWYLVEILFLPGTKGGNRFGPDPRLEKTAN